MNDNPGASQATDEPCAANAAAPTEPRAGDTIPAGDPGIAHLIPADEVSVVHPASTVTLPIRDAAAPVGTWIMDTALTGEADAADALRAVEPSVADIPVAEPPPLRETFRAGQALAALVVVFGSQIAIGIAVVIAVAIAVPRNQLTGTMARFNPLLLLVGGAVTLVTTWGLAKMWAPAWLRDRTLAGLGPLRLSRRQILTTVLAGLAMGALFSLATDVIPVPKSFHLGPLADIAEKGGVGRLAWAVAALLLAPLGEELLFRGLLLRGLTVSWGVAPAAVCVTVLFTGMHLTETFGYWPAVVAILCLSITTLMVRLRRGVLAGAVLHASYNFVLVVSLYAGKIV